MDTKTKTRKKTATTKRPRGKRPAAKPQSPQRVLPIAGELLSAEPLRLRGHAGTEVQIWGAVATIVGTIMLQTATLFWWGGAINARVEALEKQSERVESRLQQHLIDNRPTPALSARP